MNTQTNNKFEDTRRKVLEQRKLPTLAHSPSLGNEVYWFNCECNNCIQHSDPEGYKTTVKIFMDEIIENMNKLVNNTLITKEEADNLRFNSFNDLKLLREYMKIVESISNQNVTVNKVYDNTHSFTPLMPVQTLADMGIKSINFPK